MHVWKETDSAHPDTYILAAGTRVVACPGQLTRSARRESTSARTRLARSYARPGGGCCGSAGSRAEQARIAARHLAAAETNAQVNGTGALADAVLAHLRTSGRFLERRGGQMVADSLWRVRRRDRLVSSNCSACWAEMVSIDSSTSRASSTSSITSWSTVPDDRICKTCSRSIARVASRNRRYSSAGVSVPSRRPSFSTSHPAGPRFWSGPDLPLRRYRWAVGSGRAHRWRRCWRSAERLRPGAHRSGHPGRGGAARVPAPAG